MFDQLEAAKQYSMFRNNDQYLFLQKNYFWYESIVFIIVFLFFFHFK